MVHCLGWLQVVCLLGAHTLQSSPASWLAPHLERDERGVASAVHNHDHLATRQLRVGLQLPQRRQPRKLLAHVVEAVRHQLPIVQERLLVEEL